ncbi:MAG: LacI family DNA-binding transcriptional regulator [Sphaerochaetaceae bacterium]
MTISEIAKLAGVSIGTVDRVLHNRGRVAPETIEKILTIAKEFEYQPNAFARNLKLSKPFRIGVLLPKLHSEYGYWDLVYEGILKASKELSQLSVSIGLAEFDREEPSTFIQKAKHLLEIGVDAILLAPILTEETRTFLSMAGTIPYAFIDSPLPGTRPVSSLAQDPFKGGFLAGRMMHLFSPEKGTYIVVQTHKGAFNSTERSRGFFSYFADKEGFHVLEVESLPHGEEGKKMIKALYDQYEDLHGIFVVNDAVHLFAKYVKEEGRKPQTTLIGYDLIEQNRKALENGDIQCLISQRPSFQGYTAVYQLYRMRVLAQKPDETIKVPVDIIIKENLIS